MWDHFSLRLVRVWLDDDDGSRIYEIRQNGKTILRYADFLLAMRIWDELLGEP
jgi:hypothetical protein